MKYEFNVSKLKETNKGTAVVGIIKDRHVANQIERMIKNGEITGSLHIDDPSLISSPQRRKIFAIINDISKYTGEIPEIERFTLTKIYCDQKDIPFISLRQDEDMPNVASKQQASEFITFLIDFCFQMNIPTRDTLLNVTEEISAYLYLCIKHKKCALCQKPADIHHEDAIGMGNDRKTLDDSKHKKIALCREHHNIAHNIGIDSFRDKYKIYGIVVDEKDYTQWKEIK